MHLDPCQILMCQKLFNQKACIVRPSMQQYLSTREELDEASKTMFEKISSGKVKIKIFKKYKLEEVVQAHKDLEGRKILGPAVIVPN